MDTGGIALDASPLAQTVKRTREVPNIKTELTEVQSTLWISSHPEPVF